MSLMMNGASIAGHDSILFMTGTQFRVVYVSAQNGGWTLVMNETFLRSLLRRVPPGSAESHMTRTHQACGTLLRGNQSPFV